MSTANNTTQANLSRLCAVRASFASGDSPRVKGYSERAYWAGLLETGRMLR
jgi:hypothetical protein